MKRAYSARKLPYKKRKSSGTLTKKAYTKDKQLETYGGPVKLFVYLWSPGIVSRICRTRETTFSIVYNSGSGITKTTAGYNFKLSDFQSSDVTALFDQYRFVGIEFKMMPRNIIYAPQSSAPSPPVS